ncbi:sulfite exporter TauE/SafE family protein [Neorhizobium sp. CSC1952]|uniref:sulfite exporter TauE/SafE family protein n=1 Tax=Neorhizobium sp. CSC1952 TaxID=2978974 RepID=UPI0025A665D4|nr:sulfite exporter TauE/SafE family protein [Rhizobium sp. CSC1952]WJR67868.1 sulfite exporter TauE/SafE family protein [Rhizobium sp. CSC1952]
MDSQNPFSTFVGTLLPGHGLPELAFMFFAAVIAGLARGFSGFGGALIFVPLAGAAVGPKIAPALLLVIDGITTLGMLPEGWRRANRREVGTMLVGALVGVPAGTALLAVIEPTALRWLISIVVLGLLAFLISGWRYHGTPKTWLTVVVGAIAGLFGGATQLSGPPIVAYWLGGAIPPLTVRANLILYFALATVISAVSYVVGHLLTLEVLALALIAGPGYGVGLFLGSRLFGVASEGTFRRICFLLIAMAAIVGLPLFDTLRP